MILIEKLACLVHYINQLLIQLFMSVHNMGGNIPHKPRMTPE